MTDKTLPRYEHNGRNLTVPEWATLTGVRGYDINMRLRQGWTLARIIEEVKPTAAPADLTVSEPEPKKAPPKPTPWTSMCFTHNGVTDSLRGWSHKSGIPIRVLCGRLRAGWGLHRAITFPVGGARQPLDKGRPTRLLTYQGITLTLSKWAKRIGVTPSTLQWRLERWPLDKVLSTPSRENLNRLRRLSGEAPTLKEAAAEAGIAYSTVVTRLRAGWTLTDALTVPPRSIMGNDAHRAARARCSNDAQPDGAETPEQAHLPGGGEAISEAHRGPAGDASRESLPKQAFS